VGLPLQRSPLSTVEQQLRKVHEIFGLSQACMRMKDFSCYLHASFCCSKFNAVHFWRCSLCPQISLTTVAGVVWK
jgi:hypothetical protein